MYASASCEWGTPPELVKALAGLFGAFDLDPCARAEWAAKAPRWYSEKGLERLWSGNVFCNPPWSKTKPIDAWVAKALTSDWPVTMLVPARTDTKWFRKLMEKATVIAFIHGRLKYVILETPEERQVRHDAWVRDREQAVLSGDTKKLASLGTSLSDGTTAPFPSAVVHLRPGEGGGKGQTVGLMSTRGELLI